MNAATATAPRPARGAAPGTPHRAQGPRGDHPRVHIRAGDRAAHEVLAAALRRGALEAAPAWSPGTVLIAAAGTVDEALDACPPTGRPGERRPLLIADRFTAAGVLRAVRAGVRAMLHSADVPAQLVAAVHAAHHGEGLLPHGVLVGLLDAEREPLGRDSPLTAQQTLVLSLVAEGHDNAAIARALSCSQHTVKNALYDLMSRLQVRNRAHAVARAVRDGLI